VDRPVPLTAPAQHGATFEVTITRRHLLLAGGAAISGLALLRGAGALERSLGARSPLGLRRSDYTHHVGSSFRLTGPGGASVIAPLVAVSNVSGPARLAGSEDAFILIFHASPRQPRLGQAVMDVHHPRGWSRRLLISPASPGHDGVDYATVINRAQP